MSAEPEPKTDESLPTMTLEVTADADEVIGWNRIDSHYVGVAVMEGSSFIFEDVNSLPFEGFETKKVEEEEDDEPAVVEFTDFRTGENNVKAVERMMKVGLMKYGFENIEVETYF